MINFVDIIFIFSACLHAVNFNVCEVINNGVVGADKKGEITPSSR